MKHDKYHAVEIKDLALTKKEMLCSGHGNGEWRLYFVLTIDEHGLHETYFAVEPRKINEAITIGDKVSKENGRPFQFGDVVEMYGVVVNVMTSGFNKRDYVQVEVGVFSNTYLMSELRKVPQDTKWKSLTSALTEYNRVTGCA